MYTILTRTFGRLEADTGHIGGKGICFQDRQELEMTRSRTWDSPIHLLLKAIWSYSLCKLAPFLFLWYSSELLPHVGPSGNSGLESITTFWFTYYIESHPTSWVFFKYVKLTSASGPLYLHFLLPEMLFSSLFTCLAPSLHLNLHANLSLLKRHSFPEHSD